MNGHYLTLVRRIYTNKMSNRLKLNFALQGRDERVAFLKDYLKEPMFQSRPPTEDELDTMANYILWGVNPATGKNGKQEGLDLPTRHGTWEPNTHDSLDELMEQPTFNETSIRPFNEPKLVKKREVFSRDEALANCPPEMVPAFRDLFSRIDRTEFCVTTWEIEHGKRTKEMRPTLLNKFSEEEQRTLREKVSTWNQYHYLNMRHLLVELRREQYTLKDCYQTSIISQSDPDFTEERTWEFDGGVEVLPLGAKHKGNLVSSLVFAPWTQLNPQNFSEEDLKKISTFYWQKKEYTPSGTLRWFDFRDPEHVYALLNIQLELEAECADCNENSQSVYHTNDALLAALQFYVEHAELSDIHTEILNMKLHKKKNIDIAWEINHKYNKTYTANYISTIFKQRIIPRICAAAELHEKIVGNLFFEEEFKTCTGCGVTMLRAPENFTRKTRSSDGFSSRCKKCEKIARTGGTVKND